MKEECLDNFYIRIPVNPINYYYDNIISINEKEMTKFIEEIIDNYNELIFTSSIDLFEFINNNGEWNLKQFKSLLKYMIRSSVRTTPYGLLSGTIKGKFALDEYFELNDSWMKRVTIDSEWVFEYCKILEKKVGLNLKVTVNNALIYKKERVYNYGNSFYSSDNLNFDIKNTNILKRISLFCPYGVFKKMNEIIDFLLEEYGVEKKVVENYIIDLVKNEFLISDIRPPLINSSLLQFLVDKVDFYGLKDDLQILKIILKEIKLYNCTPFNNTKSVSKCKNIITTMKQLCDCNNFLKFDCYSLSEVSLPNTAKDEIAEFKEFLELFEKNNLYKTYHDKYIDKFGYASVKYLDMVDSIFGIGFPEKDIVGYDSGNFQTLYNFLYKANSNIIDLSKIEESLIKENNPYNSLELSFHIIKHGTNYQYLCSPMLGSTVGEKSFGRFSYLYDKKIGLNNNNKTINVEVSFIPKDKRVGNVLLCQSNNDYLLEFSYFSDNKKKRLDLNDVYVSPHNGKLVFFHKNTKENLNFIYTNMVNVTFLPKVLETLVNLTESKSSNIFSLFYYLNDFYKDRLYLPEIRYKNFVISPEKWVLHNTIFENLSNFNTFLKQFEKIKNDFSIPNSLMNVGHMDNYILLDINNKIHLQIVYEQLRSNTQIFLSRNYVNMENLVIRKGNKKYIGEFVIQFSANSRFNERYVEYPIIDKKELMKNTFLPYDNCIYMKIYSNKVDQNYILINYIYNFLKKIQKLNFLEKLFFIRYKDNMDHIRLRIFYNSKSKNVFFEEVLSFQKMLYESGLIMTISFDSYVREYQRYGGVENISFFEEYFSCETIDIIDQLSKVRNKQTNIKEDVLFVLSSIKTLDILFNDEMKSLSILEDFKCKSYYKNELNNFKKDNKKYIDSLYKKESNLILNCTHMKDRELSERINDNQIKTIEVKSILLSLLHMRFNRIIGIDREKENKLMSFAENIVYSHIKRSYYEKEQGNSDNNKKTV